MPLHPAASQGEKEIGKMLMMNIGISKDPLYFRETVRLFIHYLLFFFFLATLTLHSLPPWSQGWYESVQKHRTLGPGVCEDLEMVDDCTGAPTAGSCSVCLSIQHVSPPSQLQVTENFLRHPFPGGALSV